MEDELKIVLKSEDALRLDMQDQQPLELLLGNPVTYTGTTNYNELGNKPSINSVTLQGNKTASDLNLVHRGGDAMTGVLFVPNLVTKWGVEFQNQSETLTGGMYQDTANNNNQVYFDEYTGAGKRECYMLPSPTATETSYHNILTDKYAVTIAQGGTGAASASGARTNLGLGSMATASTSDYVPKSGTTLTGSLTLAATDGLITNNAAGWKTDQYGNFVHRQSTATDAWALKNNSGTSKFAVKYEDGIVTTGIWNGTAIGAAYGGTGQTSLQATRNAMGLGNTTGALPVANGGTGATSASAARTNLGLSFSLSGTELTITVT